MSQDSAQHSTIVLARTYDAPVAEVFAAFTDPEDRARIFSRSEQLTVAFEEADLRPGGRDVFRFGTGEDLRFRSEAIYHDVVPQQRIVYTDVVSEGDLPVWISATTLEFSSLDQRTQLKLTAQTVGLGGGKLAEGGAHARYAAMLDDLERHLGGELRFRPRTVTSG